MLIAMVFLFFCSPAYGYHGKITLNQIKAKEYISQLQAGADPDSLTRPHLRRDKNNKMKQSRREIQKAMDDAEALARAGKYQLIKEPEFKYNGIPEDKYRAMRNEKQNSNY